MGVDKADKIQALEKAIEIAIAAAGSGGTSCCSDKVLADIIKTTYDQMLEINKDISSTN